MPSPQSAAQQARNALGAAARRGDPPEVIDHSDRELAEANLTDTDHRRPAQGVGLAAVHR